MTKRCSLKDGRKSYVQCLKRKSYYSLDGMLWAKERETDRVETDLLDLQLAIANPPGPNSGPYTSKQVSSFMKTGKSKVKKLKEKLKILEEEQEIIDKIRIQKKYR